MRPRYPHSKRSQVLIRTAAAAACLPLLVATGAATADDSFDLLYDLRVHGDGGKTAQVNSLGDVVTLDLFVIIPDGNGNPVDDSLKLGIGGFVSSPGGLFGDLLGLPSIDPFTASGSDQGMQRDLDMDGDYDVGALQGMETGFDFYSFRSGSWENNMPDGGFLVGQVSFTTKSLSGSTEVNWLLREEYTSVLFRRDGVMLNAADSRLALGEPVRIFYGGPVIEPGETQFLSGTIEDHLNVRGTIKPAPGTTLVLAQGLDVAAGGTLDTRDASGNFGPHQVRVENEVSGNSGGTIFAGELLIGQSGTGVFTHSGGFTNIGSTVTVGGNSGTSATLRVTGGTLLAGPTSAGHGGAALLQHSGGNSTYRSLSLAYGAGDTTVVEVTGDAHVSVAGDARVGIGGAAVVRQSGGMVNVAGDAIFGEGPSADGATAIGTLELSGGTFAANRGVFGAAGAGIAEHTGGTAQFQFLGVTAPSSAATTASVSRYTISGGVLRTSSLFVGDDGGGGSAHFVQRGGEVHIDSSLGVHSRVSDARVELHDGTLTVRWEFVGEVDARGTLAQSGGAHSVDELKIASQGEFQYGGGTLRINKTLQHQGMLNFTDAPVTLTAGDQSFLDFSAGQLLNTANARIVAGQDSLLNFPAGFDPYSEFAEIQTQGLIHIAGEPLKIQETQSVHGTGSIEGDVTNEGLVSPGNSPGLLEVIGSYTQTATGTLHIEIGGSGEDSFDLVSIKGDAQLDGRLTVALLGDFVPSPEDRFTILAAEDFAGVFDNAPTTIAIEQGIFDVVYTDGSVTLANFVAVPEPGAAILLLLPLLLGRRRRQSRNLNE